MLSTKRLTISQLGSMSIFDTKKYDMFMKGGIKNLLRSHRVIIRKRGLAEVFSLILLIYNISGCMLSLRRKQFLEAQTDTARGESDKWNKHFN